MSDLKRSINSLMRQFRRDYPNIEFTVTRDQTELLDYSIGNLIDNIIVGIILACVVILLFMRDLRSPLLVILTNSRNPYHHACSYSTSQAYRSI